MQYLTQCDGAAVVPFKTVAAIFTTLKKFWTCYWKCFYEKERKSQPRAKPGLESGLYPNLSLIPLTLPHQPAKIPKILSKYTNKLSFLTVTSITGDPSPFRKF